ncbi:Flp pilus assembly complex ATPase component TadA [Candidatus Kuenenbacteria bacterium]|nr:Flp pilus assembly complex ATPase component TadA [Candidatus Kuenenbacteria bacterium]
MPSTAQTIIFNKLLTTVVERRASDLHLTIGTPPALRIEGELVILEDQEILTPDFIKGVIDSFLTPEQKEKLKKNKQLVVAHSFDQKLRFKITVYYQKGFLGVIFRYISPIVKNFSDLGLPVKSIEKFLSLKKGLVVISGPFDSGKTTTLISIIETINKTKKKNIFTLEEPIEYIFINDQSIIEQREIKKDVNSFVEGLDLISNEDVNIVFVSQITDKEVFSKIFKLIEGGRLVFVILEAEQAYQTIEKIINFFPSSEKEKIQEMLTNNLAGIINQKLIPSLNKKRILAYEILIANLSVKNLIKEGKLKQLNSILQISQAEGMIGMDKCLAQLVRNAEISLEEALRNAIDMENLKTMAERIL